MGKSDLRPIGTEFTMDLGICLSSADSRGRIAKYKVVGHSLCTRFWGDKEGELLEEIELVSTEYYNIDYSKYVWNFTHG